jgi:hypothetical protein
MVLAELEYDMVSLVVDKIFLEVCADKKISYCHRRANLAHQRWQENFGLI